MRINQTNGYRVMIAFRRAEQEYLAGNPRTLEKAEARLANEATAWGRLDEEGLKQISVSRDFLPLITRGNGLRGYDPDRIPAIDAALYSDGSAVLISRNHQPPSVFAFVNSRNFDAITASLDRSPGTLPGAGR